jgi:hypothetical protein
MGKTETTSSKIRNKVRVSILSLLSQYSAGIPSHSNRQEKEIKGLQIEMDKAKLFLFETILSNN